MGVLNVTPDSFFDGAKWSGESAAAHAAEMLQDGADLIDIGGESTRPGAEPVSAADEIARVVPVVAALRARSDAPISIDTMKPEVAEAAFTAGANIWNDVAALTAPGALDMAAKLNVSVILMHMQGSPRTMQANPDYNDVVEDVIAFLQARIQAAAELGLTDIWLDPGIGFGKTLEHNLALLVSSGRIAAETGRPVLIGASRKSFIAKLDDSSADERLGGSLAAALLAAQSGASMLRVHDVRDTVQALKLWRAAEQGP
jgi:dihydropteroate synthase